MLGGSSSSSVNLCLVKAGSERTGWYEYGALLLMLELDHHCFRAAAKRFFAKRLRTCLVDFLEMLFFCKNEWHTKPQSKTVLIEHPYYFL